MNAITRLGLWIVRMSAPQNSEARIDALIRTTAAEVSDIERDQRMIRERLAIAIYDAKAANILRKPERRKEVTDA
jgi:hypothetical protein